MKLGTGHFLSWLLASVFFAGSLLLPPKSYAAPAPSITNQPQSQVVVAGSNAVFAVGASGQSPLAYQWSFNGTNLVNGGRIGGAMDATLTVSNVNGSDAGNYRVVVTNSHGSATSSNATLTVLFPPTITSQPADQSVALSNSASFTVAASGTGTLSYQWQHAATNLANSTRVSGATTATLTISNCGFDDAGEYRAVVSNAYGVATSAAATLIVSQPTISAIPDRTIFPDLTNAIPFVVTAAGTPVDTLALSAAAANNVLIPTNGFAFTGTGTNRVLLVAPAHNQRGITPVTVTVTDTNGATASDSFTVTVQHTFTGTGVSFSGNTVWGDYDNDGFQDVLVLSPVNLYHNNGNGTFTQVSQSFAPLTSAAADWGDYDNDGYLDLALMGWTGAGWVTRLFHNNGNGTFTMVDAGLPGLSGSLAWGDYDNDGDLDLLVTGSTTTNSVYITEVYRNDHGTFTAGKTGLPAAGPSREPWGDYNCDGRLDLLLGTSIFKNNGDGTFTDIGANIVGVFGGNTCWGDYDNDGYLDVAIIGFDGAGPTNRTTLIYHNNRDGTFSKSDNRLQTLSNSDLAWGDFDNDGWLDIAITGTTNYTGSTWTPTLLYHNNGDGTFNTQPVELAGIAGLRWVDYNNDGALDLVACAGYPLFNTPGLYHNDTPKKDVPPAPPEGLNAQVSTNGIVFFTWSAATDSDGANPPGLTYNLRVGTTPGGVEIMSPAADVATGRRRITARGNASSTNFWFLQNLPRGTYYWSVQAIDPAFAGSAFSAEASFTVTNARPVISPVPPQTVSHSILSQPIPFIVTDLETPSTALVVTASSSDTNLIPDDRIYPGGTDSNRVVQVQPATNQTGSVTITLVVTDEGGDTTNTSFVVNITNFPPWISGLSDLSLQPGQTVPVVPFQIGDNESSPDELLVTVSSSNTNFVANTNLTLSGAGSNRFLQIVAPSGVKGATTISLVVRDPSGASVTGSFVFRVGDFNPLSAGLPDVQQGAVDWGDYDNDGRLDVLICGRLADGTAITRVYHNNGNGSFTDIQAGLPGISGASPPTVSWGDFNGDNQLDFVLAGGGITRIYRNNGDGTFTDIAAGLPVSVAAASMDYDNDGDLDLVLARGGGVSPSPTVIYRNNGDGTFTNSGISLPTALAVAAADYDNDGDVDILLGGAAGKQSVVPILMRNDGNGVFTSIDAGFQAVTTGSWAWGDYDQDDRLDLLMTGINSNNSFTSLYHNNTNNTFTLVATNLPGITAGLAAWGDLDNDGDPDIFLTGLIGGRLGGRVARIYRNDGGAIFVDSGEPMVGTHWSAASLGDFDSDGLLDVLYCGTTNGLSAGSGTLLYRNGSVSTNTPPTAPTGATVLPGAVLSWNPATDAQTTNAGGLTYNLRIGTNAGGCQIMSPEADMSTGFRRVARMGNVGPATHWPAQLPPGTYYWSVQAIDPAFAGSAFAPESSFTIPHQAAVITGTLLGPQGQFSVSFDGETNATYRVLVSSNLLHWSILGSATQITPGKFEFLDSLPPSMLRFYRVSSP